MDRCLGGEVEFRRDEIEDVPERVKCFFALVAFRVGLGGESLYYGGRESAKARNLSTGLQVDILEPQSDEFNIQDDGEIC